jgi:hypothetical protein
MHPSADPTSCGLRPWIRLISDRRGLIHLVDRAALEEIACECSRLMPLGETNQRASTPRRAIVPIPSFSRDLTRQVS